MKARNRNRGRGKVEVNIVKGNPLSIIEVISTDIGRAGGICRYVDSLNHVLLSQEKIRIHIIYPSQEDQTINEEKFGNGVIIHHRIKVHPTSLFSPFSLLNKIKRICEAIGVIARKERVHIIHTHTPFAPLWIIASCHAGRKLGIPCVATAHNVLFSRPALSIIAYCIVNVLIARGLYLTGVCEETLGGILGAKPAIGSGIDTNVFNQQNVSEEDINKFKTLHGFSDYPLIFYPARIIKKKGQMDLIRLSRKLFKNGIQIQVLLIGNVGDKKYADCMSAEIIRLKLQDYIKILPHSSPDNVCVGYAASSIVAFPSYDEALPLVALESAAMERPIVAYNAGGMREAITHGTNGYIVPKGDIDAMCQYVKKMLQNDCLRSNMGKNGRKLVKKNYDNVILANRHLKLYRELSSKNQA